MSEFLALIFKYLPILIQLIVATNALVKKYEEIVGKSREENRPISDEEMGEIVALRKAAVAKWDDG